MCELFLYLHSGSFEFIFSMRGSNLQWKHLIVGEVLDNFAGNSPKDTL